jgi:hypothetical protein
MQLKKKNEKVVLVPLAIFLSACSPPPAEPKKEVKAEVKDPAPAAVKEQPLSAKDEKALIHAAENQVTPDGATVLQVIQHAEKMRPKEFKAGPFEILYTSEGKPTSVGVCYWIGSKRLEGDKYCDISFSFSPDHKSFKPEIGSVSKELQQETAVVKLLQGRDVFLKAVDDFYTEACVGPDKKKTC